MPKKTEKCMKEQVAPNSLGLFDIAILASSIQCLRHPDKALSNILSIAKKDTTEIGGTTRMRICDYLPAWIRIGYETGMRHGDILNLNATELRNGCVCKAASKTGKSLVRKIESETQK